MTGPNGSWSPPGGLSEGPATQEDSRLRLGVGVLRALRRAEYLCDVSEEHSPANKLLFMGRDLNSQPLLWGLAKSLSSMNAE